MKIEEAQSLLSKASIFSSLSEEDLLRLAGLVKPREYRSGEVIIHQGDFGDSIYFICRGKVEVYLKNMEGAKTVIRNLQEGDFFGEMAILTGAPRSASVRVLEDSLVLFLYKSDFDDMIQRNPHLTIYFSRMLAERLTATTALYMHQIDKDDQLKKLLSKEKEQHITHLVGRTKQFQAIGNRIDELALSDEPLIISGPEGTATEDVARLIHIRGPRRDQPFMILDIGGGEEWRVYRQRILSLTGHKIDKDKLFEEFQISSLFGHEPGSLPGAEARRLGHIELADGGVLVLKNVDRLSAGARERLLFYLLERKSYRLGALEGHKTDTLIIATLNYTVVDGDLEKRYHGIIPEILWKNRIDVPSLHKRRRDIPLIARSYLEKHAAESGKRISSISPQALNTLVRYSWPGNDRELESVVERGVMVCQGETLLTENIFLGLKPYSEKGRINILRNSSLREAFSNQALRSFIEGFMVLIMIGIIALAFFGTQEPGKNLGAGLVWYYWWPYLLLSFLVFSRIYCSVCPVNGIAKLARKLGSLNLKTPHFFNRIGVAVAAFLCLGLFWFEAAFGLRNMPVKTAYLLIAIILAAVLFNFIYKPEVWCRYLCPLGYFCGVYSCLAVVELRANNNVCSSQCKTTDCYKGDEHKEGCPMNLFPVSLLSNQFCKMCGTCVRNCPYHSIHLDLRWPGSEIWNNREPNLATSLSIPALLGMVFPLFLRESNYPITAGRLDFTIIFWAFGLGTVVLFSVASLTGGKAMFKRFASVYGFTYLPIAFAGHLAFQFPFLLKGLQLLAPEWKIADSHNLTIHWIQFLIISAGFIWSLSAVGKASGNRLTKAGTIHGILIFSLGITLMAVL